MMPFRALVVKVYQTKVKVISFQFLIYSFPYEEDTLTIKLASRTFYNSHERDFLVVDDVFVLFSFSLSCDLFFSSERVDRIKERGTCLKLCLTTSGISLLLLACEQASKWNSHRSDQSDHDTRIWYHS